MSYKTKEQLRNCINGRNIIDLSVEEKESYFYFDHGGYSYLIEFEEKDLIECIETFSLNVQHAVNIKMKEDGEFEAIEYENILHSNDYDLLNEPDIVAECIENGMHFTVESITKRVVTMEVKSKLKKLWSFLGKEGTNV